jgi:hypothetical protein
MRRSLHGNHEVVGQPSTHPHTPVAHLTRVDYIGRTISCASGHRRSTGSGSGTNGACVGQMYVCEGHSAGVRACACSIKRPRPQGGQQTRSLQASQGFAASKLFGTCSSRAHN